MKTLGLTQKEFAAKLCVAEGTLSSIFNGRTKPTNNLVQAAVGIVLSVVLYTALSKVPEIHKAFWKGE